MLILSRRESECIHLGDDIVLTIVRVSGEKVRIGVDAPPHIKILRNELDVAMPSDLSIQTPDSATSVLPQGASSEVIVPPVSLPVRKVPIQVRRAG